MTVAECAMAAFALLNSGRALAYVPQIVRVYRDQNGAAAVSLITWAMFASSNLATAVYAHAVYSDALMATVFALNTLACLLVVILTAMKRSTFVWRRVSGAGGACEQPSPRPND
jgi:uncharacterized protein with PQ loop repeat